MTRSDLRALPLPALRDLAADAVRQWSAPPVNVEGAPRWLLAEIVLVSARCRVHPGHPRKEVQGRPPGGAWRA
jgi:hypothetical protein